MVHLVYCDNAGKDGTRVIDKIKEGTKTMVVRGAAGRKIPHSRVKEGETLYFMEKGTLKISMMATVKSVQNYVKLTEEIVNVLEENQDKLNLSEKQKTRWHKKCLCLVKFEGVTPIEPALDFDYQGNMDDRLSIEKIEDVVIGTSISYNYDESRF